MEEIRQGAGMRNVGVDEDHHHTFSKNCGRGIKELDCGSEGMGGRVSNDQCEIILSKGGSREPNPDDHRPNMGKAGTLTAVAVCKQCAWASDIYSPKNATQRWVLSRLSALQKQKESAVLHASAAWMGFFCLFVLDRKFLDWHS